MTNGFPDVIFIYVKYCEVLALKKVALLLCAVLIILPFGFYTFANESAEPVLVVGYAGNSENVSPMIANAGDTVIVPVSIKNNPGIVDYAFDIGFNTGVLTYISCAGNDIDNYSVYDHSSEGKLTFVCINDLGKDDKVLINFAFKIKDDAKVGKYPVTVDSTYFANKRGRKIKVKTDTSNNAVEVTEPCGEEHEYSNIEYTATPNSCTHRGVSVLSCKKCNHTNIVYNDATGHTLEKHFTVDFDAVGSKQGMLSRHCTTCGARTNIIIYDTNNLAALTINDVVNNLSDDSIENLVYFLNGQKTYPDIESGDIDAYAFIFGNRSMINSDGTINVGLAVDHSLRKYFGDDKKSGIVGELKKASISKELKLGPIGKLVFSILT